MIHNDCPDQMMHNNTMQLIKVSAFGFISPEFKSSWYFYITYLAGIQDTQRSLLLKS